MPRTRPLRHRDKLRSKPFVWTAKPKLILAAVKRGKQATRLRLASTNSFNGSRMRLGITLVGLLPL